MGEKQQFLTILKPIKRQLYIEKFVREVQVLLLLLCFIYFVWMMLARVFVLPLLTTYILISITIVLLLFCVRIWLKRPQVSDAVKLMNYYVQDDRVQSAYSFLHQEGIVEQLLINDAISHMKVNLTKALSRKKRWLYPSLIIGAVVCFTFGLLSYYFPNTTMEAGRNAAKEQQIVKQLKKELEEDLAKMDTDEGKKIAEKTKEKLNEVKSAEQLMEMIEKSYKELQLQQLKEEGKIQELANITSQLKEAGLHDLASQIEAGGSEGEISAQLEKLQANFSNLTTEQQNALKTLTDSNNFGKEEASQLAKKISSGQKASMAKSTLLAQKNALTDKANQLASRLDNANIQENIRQQIQNSLAALQQSHNNEQGQNGNNSSGNSGGETNSNGTNDNPGSQNGDSQAGNNQGQQNGNNGNGNNQGAGNTSGNGSGTSSGSGQGNSNGSGQGNQSGTGNSGGVGGGTGAGLGHVPNLFLAIPEYINGKDNLQHDFGPIGSGKKGDIYETDGPIGKGSLRPYQEVYSQYEKAYRESINRYNLPAELESIVKNYFSNVKP